MRFSVDDAGSVARGRPAQMNGPIKNRTLLELAALPDPMVKVEKLFDWYFERHKLLIEVAGVSVGAFFAALIVALLKGEYDVNNWWWVAVVAAILLLATGSAIRRSYLIMKGMEDQFIVALQLLARLLAP
jgi:hypothetical protein